MVNVEVVIPIGKNDSAGRIRVRDWIVERYRREHPDYRVTLAGCPTRDWSKGRAANPLLLGSTADVVILADADSYVHPRMLAAAALAVADNPAGWGFPHTLVRRITGRDTARILDGEQVPRPGFERTASVLPGGGIVAATPQAWRHVGGVDPRFVGWGGEDFALGCALHMLRGAPSMPQEASILWHLWHPSGKRRTSADTQDLLRRYRIARRGDREQMAALVGEWR
jgi:cellulose synthase/poly-beta-1,6-N-acetylglucosamine synthase-like glycosyltransferase